jgi:hypothetical protein
MKVIVPSISEDCPTALALTKEGVPFELVLMENEYSYSDMFCELWKVGEGFILLEHDIVPWPGAITALDDCEQPWCSYEYPLAPNTLRPALGCIKVCKWVVKSNPDLPLHFRWAGTMWGNVDGRVCPALESIVGKTHIHTPPLAHVKK